MPFRLLFVHAHPDDESSKGAAAAAHYLDAGAEVTLVTCTGGEAGEVLNPHAPAVEPEQMAATRARELANAIAAIGFTRAYQLGYVDSGYHERAEDVPDGTFARVPLDEAARRLAAIVRTERPHAVVTYPADGGYPHPDHVANHAVTMRALAIAEEPGDPDVPLDGRAGRPDPRPWRVPKVYASQLFPVERLDALRDAVAARDPDSELLTFFEERRKRTSPVVPDTRIECAAHFTRRDTALRAHVTQIDPTGRWFQLPRDLEREAYPYEAYTVLRSDVQVRRPEDDLFAGLEPDDDRRADLGPAT
ncbi:MAG: PIG-L family deacetylase [Nitriliruptoraceae bacterium]